MPRQDLDGFPLVQRAQRWRLTQVVDDLPNYPVEYVYSMTKVA
jgi:hypothetical protein